MVCGACRGVGKTYVAREMCRVLPRSIHAKLGHGKPDRGKSGNFFTGKKDLQLFLLNCSGSCEHAVIEGNPIAIRKRGATVIFIDASAGFGGLRKDTAALKSRADICICADASRKKWERILRRRLTDAVLVGKLCDVFECQKRHMEEISACPSFSRKLGVKSKIWFVRGNKHVLGHGLACLLEQVDRVGSLRQAAEIEGMSYRYAWGEIRSAEEHLGMKLLLRSKGGRAGGGSSLSPEGRRLLRVFYEEEARVKAYADEQFAELLVEEREGALPPRSSAVNGEEVS